MNQNISFLNEDGEARTSSIFNPLLSILRQAFAEGAEEVYINYSRVTPGCISAWYTRGDKIFPLNVEANFSPADVFARLKIISGMSIVVEGCQAGETIMCFENRTLKVSVQINTEETQETISLKPDYCN